MEVPPWILSVPLPTNDYWLTFIWLEQSGVSVGENLKSRKTIDNYQLFMRTTLREGKHDLVFLGIFILTLRMGWLVK